MKVKIYNSTENFEQDIAEGVTLVDFNAPWCAPCRAQEPIIEELAAKYKEKASVASMNIDKYSDIAVKLGIRSIPTIIVFKKSKEIQRFVGLQAEKILAEAIDNAL
jgi:thioredoxin 1